MNMLTCGLQVLVIMVYLHILLVLFPTAQLALLTEEEEQSHQDEQQQNAHHHGDHDRARTPLLFLR